MVNRTPTKNNTEHPHARMKRCLELKIPKSPRVLSAAELHVLAADKQQDCKHEVGNKRDRWRRRVSEEGVHSGHPEDSDHNSQLPNIRPDQAIQLSVRPGYHGACSYRFGNHWQNEGHPHRGNRLASCHGATVAYLLLKLVHLKSYLAEDANVGEHIPEWVLGKGRLEAVADDPNVPKLTHDHVEVVRSLHLPQYCRLLLTGESATATGSVKGVRVGHPVVFDSVRGLKRVREGDAVVVQRQNVTCHSSFQRKNARDTLRS